MMTMVSMQIGTRKPICNSLFCLRQLTASFFHSFAAERRFTEGLRFVKSPNKCEYNANITRAPKEKAGVT